MTPQAHDRRYWADEPWKKPGRGRDESQQPNPNVVEKEKCKKRRGIVKDERGQDQPATKEDAQSGSSHQQRSSGIEALKRTEAKRSRPRRIKNRPRS